jgi:adenylate cyclase
MSSDVLVDREYRWRLRIYLEEVCAELCRFRYMADGGQAPDAVRIQREVAVGPGAFIDILVEPPDSPSYAVEIKFGYPPDVMVDHLGTKFSERAGAAANIERLVILVRLSDYPDWAETETAIRKVVNPGLEIEIWDEADLLRMINKYFHVDVDTMTRDDLLTVRRAINRAKWQFAYGDQQRDHYLAENLLWHFGAWNLRRLCEQGLSPDDILSPGRYSGIAIVMADLCSFSSYVRDTRDEDLVRHSLTAFYSRTRHAIHSAGGMLYQFVGDEVVGLFGMPDNGPGYIEHAMDCARALVDIGLSVSDGWQRSLDRVQDKSGVHIGISVGELNLMQLLPFAGNYTGFVGDAMNMSARLMNEAGPGEIVISNSFYQRLNFGERQKFAELPAVEARNVGRIKCWKLQPGGPL